MYTISCFSQSCMIGSGIGVIESETLPSGHMCPCCIAREVSKDDKRHIVVWPDYTWCDWVELEGYAWKSDDFFSYLVPVEMSDDEIDNLVSTLLEGLK